VNKLHSPRAGLRAANTLPDRIEGNAIYFLKYSLISEITAAKIT
jgi:hypothetical protein